MRILRAASLGLSLASALASGTALAEPLRGVTYVGGTLSESISGYVGAVVSLPGAQLGDGASIKAGVSGGRYEYDASGTRITAKYVGVDMAVGYQFSGNWGWANVSVGPTFARTSLSPEDPNNERNGSRWTWPCKATVHMMAQTGALVGMAVTAHLIRLIKRGCS